MDDRAEKTWQDRMQEEYYQLKERYEKLRNMLIKMEAADTINKPYKDLLGFEPNCPRYFLEEQASYMGNYLRTLKVRAVIEGVIL